jgi:hypothetical protein
MRTLVWRQLPLYCGLCRAARTITKICCAAWILLNKVSQIPLHSVHTLLVQIKICQAKFLVARLASLKVLSTQRKTQRPVLMRNQII